MPATDWYEYFAPAWQERVLDTKPKIPYLHMTDIRDPSWCKERGISWDQAQEKMDMAAILISQMGSLRPVTVNANAGMFLDAHGKKKIMKNADGPKPSRFLIDHYCFNAYVLTVLNYIHLKHPETEKVDFLVERKDGVFEKLKQFYSSLEGSLEYIGHPELRKYLGELKAAGKCLVPLQAADMLCWHVSRADLGLLKGRDANRAATIFHGRSGPIMDLPDKLHFTLARAFAKRMDEIENGISKDRRKNEESNTGSSRQTEGRSGSKMRQKEKPKDSTSGRFRIKRGKGQLTF